MYNHYKYHVRPTSLVDCMVLPSARDRACQVCGECVQKEHSAGGSRMLQAYQQITESASMTETKHTLQQESCNYQP